MNPGIRIFAKLKENYYLEQQEPRYETGIIGYKIIQIQDLRPYLVFYFFNMRIEARFFITEFKCHYCGHL